ncbi:hypothetical protein [Hydrogenophaga sp.]|uniref:hypothetical protein n=1 Tax=Hydrogenophaga sp. TaxID=1904254 RepID=UPI00261A6CF1|nr:hypothetical protein [Hydrogenophaga sp.]MDM7948408.1 hypothetical protein [Hydrogenophaga sp.]
MSLTPSETAQTSAASHTAISARNTPSTAERKEPAAPPDAPTERWQSFNPNGYST